MSFPLDDVDLTSLVAGATGTISLNNVGISAGGVSNHPSLTKTPAVIGYFNESGAGLRIAYSQGGQGFNLPAGAWSPVPLPPGENLLKWTVVYTLPNPPVSKLLLTYYPPGESVPQSMTLGNSPTGGSTATAGNILTNEAATLGAKIIDIGMAGNTDMIDFFNDHFIISVIQAGVAHQVLKGNTTGNPLQIGKAGDISEVLGQLLIDQIPSVVASPPTGTGTITIYELVVGPFKLVAVLATNLQNTSASKFSLALPTAFTAGAMIYAGNITNTELMSGVTAQSMQVLTAPNAGAPSTISNQTVLQAYNLGNISLPFDTLRFQANNVTVHDGNIMALLGV